jgi:hypothetical protein
MICRTIFLNVLVRQFTFGFFVQVNVNTIEPCSKNDDLSERDGADNMIAHSFVQ